MSLVTKETFELFSYYIALKQHFTRDDYDYFKYGGKTSLTVSTMERRKDKSFFSSLARKQKNPNGYMFANLLENPHMWIGDMVNDQAKCEKVFVNWDRRIQSLTYTFKEEIKILNNDFDSNFLVDEDHPYLLRLYIQKKISLETMVILDMIVSYLGYWDKKMQGDPIWQETSKRIKKYKPFLEINVGKYKTILRQQFDG
jgi:hypothetical protein